MLSQQALIKMTPEFEELISKCFSEYLKNTGKYISRSEFIRILISTGLSHMNELCLK